MNMVVHETIISVFHGCGSQLAESGHQPLQGLVSQMELERTSIAMSFAGFGPDRANPIDNLTLVHMCWMIK
ncbi:hypothetical protein Bca4012_019227 [Brassica carinata]